MMGWQAIAHLAIASRQREAGKQGRTAHASRERDATPMARLLTAITLGTGIHERNHNVRIIRKYRSELTLPDHIIPILFS